jgi:hypothetical protein
LREIQQFGTAQGFRASTPPMEQSAIDLWKISRHVAV